MTAPTPITSAAGATRGSRARRRDPERRDSKPWDVEYGRDVWRLREVGMDDDNRARISFAAIPQPWLKGWPSAGHGGPRHRIGRATAASSTRAVSRFAMFLATVPIDRLDQIDRMVMERYLANLHAQLAGRPVHRHLIGQLSMFFTAIRQHGWDPSLPAGAMIFPEDVPKHDEGLPRALSDLVMAQLEHPDNLARWNNPEGLSPLLGTARCPHHRWRPDLGEHPRRLGRGPGAGRVGGRPSVMTAATVRVARQMLEAGSTVTEVAATIGVGQATLYRHLDVSPMRGRDVLDVRVTS